MTIDGVVERTDGGARLIFQRRLQHSAQRVWKALTDPEERATWFFAGILEPCAGGRVDLEDHGPGIRGEILEAVPGRRLRFTWDSIDGPRSEVQFDLTAVDDGRGCLLTFTHTVNEDCRPENLMPGWHALLDDLAEMLDTGAVGEHANRHAGLRRHYAAILIPKCSS